jgi:hypothetical protein
LIVAVSYVHGGRVTLRAADSPCSLTQSHLHRPKGPTMLKMIVLGCVLAAVAITFKIRRDTPQGPQPLARAILTTHLQPLGGDLALP